MDDDVGEDNSIRWVPDVFDCYGWDTGSSVGFIVVRIDIQ